MTVESFLEEKLQKFSIVDLAFVKSVYFVVGLLVCSLYPKLAMISWLFYFLLCLICAVPLWIHLFAQSGNLLEQMQTYIKTNNPSNQVLLFLSMFFLGLMVASLLPFLASVYWWIYVIILVGLAIKPLQTSWFW